MIWRVLLIFSSLSTIFLVAGQPLPLILAVAGWTGLGWSEWILGGKFKSSADFDELRTYVKGAWVRRVLMNFYAFNYFSYLLLGRQVGSDTNGALRRQVAMNFALVLTYYIAGMVFAYGHVGSLNAKAASFIVVLAMLRPANMGFGFLAKFLFGRWI